MDKSSQQSTGFSVFAFTWAMAGSFHQLSFADWRWYDIKGVALSCAILLVLLKPSSWQRFAALVVVDWVAVAWEFPIHPNHIVFSWVVNGTLLAALVIAGRSKGVSEASLEARWYEAFAPWLRIELCVLYFFTVFHKLNVTYFDVDWSCAAKLHVEISDRFHVLPDAKWAQYAAIYGTVIIEAAIPLLLLFRRTRIAGVVLGMLFHALLALHPHPGLFSFSSTMTALFTVFLPLSTTVLLKPGNGIRKAWTWGLYVSGALLLVWIFRKLLPAELNLDGIVTQGWKAGFIGYFAYSVFGLAMLIRSLKTPRKEIQMAPGSWRRHPWLAAFTLLLLVNGFGPYFGLRTQTSFTMFSNLHTEGGMTNHLIVPSGIQITNWQYDVVEIIDSNEPDLIWTRDNGLLVVYLELRRMRSGADEDFWVTFRRNGRIETFDMKRPETYSVVPTLGTLAKRYFFFRDPSPDPMKVKCQQ